MGKNGGIMDCFSDFLQPSNSHARGVMGRVKRGDRGKIGKKEEK